MANFENRTLFENDNLPVLRALDADSVDLIYLDPPFNSNQDYAAPIGSEAAGAAFKDTWTLDDVNEAEHGELADREPALYAAIHAAELTHGRSMKSYLIMMGLRMLEMRRILKETGSIYLHCDPTASHYLKLLMDAVFGINNFRNEVIWIATLSSEPNQPDAQPNPFAQVQGARPDRAAMPPVPCALLCLPRGIRPAL